MLERWLAKYKYCLRFPGLIIAQTFSEVFFKTSPETGASTRCGIILAAGEGNRLRSFVKKSARLRASQAVCQLHRQALHARAYFLQSTKNDSGRTIVHRREPEPPAAPGGGPAAFNPADGLHRRTTRQQRHGSRPVAAACASVQTLSRFYRGGFSFGSFHFGGGSLHGLCGSSLSRRRAGSRQGCVARNQSKRSGAGIRLYRAGKKALRSIGAWHP